MLGLITATALSSLGMSFVIWRSFNQPQLSLWGHPWCQKGPFSIQTKKTQGKFVSVLKGSILDVVVDLRKNSKTFGKHFKIELTDKNGKSIFIPSGFLHGFLALQKENIVHYYNTNYRSPKHETGVIWNDKTLRIKWPTKKPILSKKDKKNLKFDELSKKLRWNVKLLMTI